MVQVADSNLPATSPPPTLLRQMGWPMGVIDLIDQSNLPAQALARGKNTMLVEDGNPAQRWGLDWYGIAPSSGMAIDGGGMHEHTDGSIHLWTVVNGTFYRSTNNGNAWTACTGATFTAGMKCDSKQIGGYTFVTNGTDVIARYDGSTTLQTYSGLTDPTDVPTGVVTGMTGTSYNSYYRYSDVNEIGFTVRSGWSAAIQTSMTRDRFDSTHYIDVTLPAAATGATRRDIFVGTSTTDDGFYIASISADSTAYRDDGSDPELVSVTAPTGNTSTGPKAKVITIIGNRIFLANDPSYPYRVWWSGSGSYIGFFSTSYDGSYIDLEPGGQYHPKIAVDYRDGKGTSLATIWCDSADGLGCVWQMSLDTQTIGTVSFSVPNAYKLPGSRGTNAPFSVTNVLNDYMYYNLQGCFNLGSRAQYLNLLSTDEATANIRKSVRTINQAASDKTAAIFFLGKWFVSAPFGTSTENNQTMVLDTEIKQKPWMPEAFDKGFERFFTYTDTDGAYHLLAWKPGDDRLTEISQDILGDYGVIFDIEVKTGIISVDPKNRFGWLNCDQADVEFSQPSGKLYIELSGNDRAKGFKVLKSKTLSMNTDVDFGYDTFAYDAEGYDDTSVTGIPYSESSVKRYFIVGKEINNFQFRITTITKNSRFVLRLLQIEGMYTEGGPPRQWKLS